MFSKCSATNETTAKTTRTAKKPTEISKTTTVHVHHAVLHISLPSLHDHDVRLPNFTFYVERELKKTFIFFFLNSEKDL